MLPRENGIKNNGQILFLTKCQGMPLKVIATAQDVTLRQYKNAQSVLCEFMAVQTYDEEEPPTYKDFNLQELHEFIADKIEALDPNNNRYQWARWQYQTKRE